MDDEQRQERAELISRMFALLTAKLEDGAGIGGEAQERDLQSEQVQDAASRLIDLGQEITAVAQAIEQLNLGRESN
ncbi:hypothetical protein [Novosphingobium sp. Gsoil 351]|uniref:hypothetical protein n=1 Tax=Novosphingobium sp. Gsoil 351 TaxID=2675225 RepID=UPI0012B4EE36|nr:hypothetical protein [Novosphingobium sp. Gsoil 351]QGN55452.1 hypothetical protein GKE62_13750 [Novosphingobium sp. Gsoil 351]